MAGATLVIDFIGEISEIGEGDQLTFGRTGDIVLDDANPYLHRIVGRFFSHGGTWWLENHGSQVTLSVVRGDGSTMQLAPKPADGAAPVTVLAPGAFTLTFTSGGHTYELLGRATAAPIVASPAPSDGIETRTFGAIPLTDDEKALLVELARPILLDPTSGPDALPGNKQVAGALGWKVSKFNRKLDYLCARMTRAGVRGLQGGRGAEALNRRWVLVEHAITAQLVTRDDIGTDRSAR